MTFVGCERYKKSYLPSISELYYTSIHRPQKRNQQKELLHITAVRKCHENVMKMAWKCHENGMFVFCTLHICTASMGVNSPTCSARSWKCHENVMKMAWKWHVCVLYLAHTHNKYGGECSHLFGKVMEMSWKCHEHGLKMACLSFVPCTYAQQVWGWISDRGRVAMDPAGLEPASLQTG